MADTEVSKEEPGLAVSEAKCGMDVVSYQDRPKPDCNGTSPHNQAEDLSNSYIFASGVDGFHEEDAPDNEDEQPEPEVVEGQLTDPDYRDVKLDVEGREFIGPAAHEANMSEDPPAVVDKNSKENRRIKVTGDDNNDSLAQKIEILAETEVENLESQIVGSGLVERSAVCRVLQDVAAVGVAECVLWGPSVRPTEDEVKLSSTVAEKAGQEDSLEVDFDENPVDVVEHEPQNVDEKSEAEAAKPKVAVSTYADFNLESRTKKSEGEVNVVEDVVECTFKDMSADEVSLSKELLENGEHGIHLSTSLDVESWPSLINSKEVTDVVECKLQDSKIKLSEEVVVDALEHEVPLSVSLDLDSGLNPMIAKEKTDVAVDVVKCELQDEDVKADNGVKLSEVVENGESEVGSSTLFDLGSNLINAMEKAEVIEDFECEMVGTADCEVPPSTSLDLNLESCPIVECEFQDVNEKAKDEAKSLERKVLESTSSDVNLECNSKKSEGEVNVAEDFVERTLQDTRADEVSLSEEVLESAKHGIHSSTSLDVESGSSLVNSKEETDMAECRLRDNEIKLSREVVLEASECEFPLSVPLDLESPSNPTSGEEEADVAVDVVECDLQEEGVKAAENEIILSEVVEDGECEVTSSSSFYLGSNLINTKEMMKVVEDVKCETVKTAKFEVPPSTSLDLNSETCPIRECDGQESSMKGKEEVKLLEAPSPPSLDLESDPENTEGKTEVAEIVVECDSQNADVKAENKVKLWSEFVEIEQELPSLSSQVTLEPEVCVGNVFATSSEEKNSVDVTSGCRTEASGRSNTEKECATNIEMERENVVDQNDGASGNNSENLVWTGQDDTGHSRDCNTPLGSISDTIHGEEGISVNGEIKPFNFLIRVPRFDNESLKEQIRLAKLNIDEKTKVRDAIQVLIQAKRANSQIHGIDYEYAKGEGRNARKLVRSKRMEIDSLQAVINKAKNALSIADIDSQIYNMERMIQHETLALKEEKQLIREIKQLKQLREQLSSNMGSQDEIKQALEQREEVEGRIKIHRKELDALKDKVLEAEAAALEAEKKYDDENRKVKELQAQFRAADKVRQAAYAQWQSLRKELSKKSQHFFKYKDDAAAASDYAFRGDTEAIYRLCTDNVEQFMEIWNSNDEFRQEYVKFNLRSTVRRLSSLDGRLLGPDKDLPVLPSYENERANNNRITVQTPSEATRASQFPILEPKQESITTKSVEKAEGGTFIPRGMDRGPNVSVHANGLLGDVSSEEMREEVHVAERSMEEVEAAKKMEEKERAEAETRLKEQRRMEAVAKAHEAHERKKRQAEKMQMRAELKTLKEAEQKEKEREKRMRKKERKKAAATDVINDTTNGEITPSLESAAENGKEIEVEDTSSVTAARKAKKHWLFGKQGKTKYIPPALRNRNKKKLQQWMWVGITSAIIVVMFWLGNVGVFSNMNLKRRSPVI